jgi:hypothetical protein
VAVRRRAEVAAERDPAPPPPTWRRDERDASDGAPLWRLVDFADGLGDAQRAGVEAALEASGLLDAWVRADGAVLDARRCDVVLPAGAPAPAGPRLSAVLRADRPAASPVAAAVVEGVLARVALGDRQDGAAAAAAPDALVGVDGRWRLGPLTGRAAKRDAQYIGATARPVCP